MNTRLRARLFANDRLLKALVTLLAIRDPGLLLDLQAICDIAAEGNNEEGNVSRDSWIDLEQELALIASLTGAAEPSIDSRHEAKGADPARKCACN